MCAGWAGRNRAGGGAVGHACSFFQIPDGKFDHCVVAVVGIEENGGSLPIGDEGVVSEITAA